MAKLSNYNYFNNITYSPPSIFWEEDEALHKARIKKIQDDKRKQEEIAASIDIEADEYPNELPDYNSWKDRLDFHLKSKSIVKGIFPYQWEEGYRKLYEAKKTPKSATKFLLECQF